MSFVPSFDPKEDSRVDLHDEDLLDSFCRLVTKREEEKQQRPLESEEVSKEA